MARLALSVRFASPRGKKIRTKRWLYPSMSLRSLSLNPPPTSRSLPCSPHPPSPTLTPPRFSLCRCVACNVECGPGSQHPGSCAAYNAWRAANDSGDTLVGRFLAGLDKARLRCPACSGEFEKDGGCNHMTCPCGAHYCAVCCDLISATRPHDHFHPGPAARSPPCPLFPGQ